MHGNEGLRVWLLHKETETEKEHTSYMLDDLTYIHKCKSWTPCLLAQPLSVLKQQP